MIPCVPLHTVAISGPMRSRVASLNRISVPNSLFSPSMREATLTVSPFAVYSIFLSNFLYMLTHAIARGFAQQDQRAEFLVQPLNAGGHVNRVSICSVLHFLVAGSHKAHHHFPGMDAD